MPDFVRLWAGQAISQMGSQVTAVALPLIAVSRLHASASDMGIVTAAGIDAPSLPGSPKQAATPSRRLRGPFASLSPGGPQH